MPNLGWSKGELIRRLEAVTRGAHYVSIIVRRGGRYESFEADFLKAVLAYLKQD